MAIELLIHIGDRRVSHKHIGFRSELGILGHPEGLAVEILHEHLWSCWLEGKGFKEGVPDELPRLRIQGRVIEIQHITITT